MSFSVRYIIQGRITMTNGEIILDNRVVGAIDLRHHIDHPILGTWGGHCGYSVRPSERRKGYWIDCSV